MNRVLIDASPYGTRIGLVENGRLTEYFYESTHHKSLVGNLYAARIDQVLEGLQAAFLDIGTDKNAYWYYGAKRAANDTVCRRPKVGDAMLVQVQKDAIGGKGAVVTQKLSFPGNFLVLLPDENGSIGISRKITDEKERDRIFALLQETLPPDFGVIVRTAAENKPKEAFVAEITHLKALVDSVRQRGTYTKPPALLHEELSPALKMAREFCAAGMDEFVVNDSGLFSTLKNTGLFAPDTGIQLTFFSEPMSLFSAFFVESQAKKALEPKVWLKSGGFLIIEETEACVVIDVNTGKFTGSKNVEKTILRTNLEAAEEIALQLRLRNLSGIIIADFIDMTSTEYKRLLSETLTKAVKKDRIKTTVIGLTELGLMQITRKKTTSPLSRQMSVRCQCCEGEGRLPSIDWVVGQIRQEILHLFAQTIYNEVTLLADPRLLYAFCGEKNTHLAALEASTGKKVLCRPLENTSFGFYELRPGKE